MLQRLINIFAPPLASELARERLQYNVRAVLLILMVASILAFLFNANTGARLGSGALFLSLLFIFFYSSAGDLILARVATPLITFSAVTYFLLTGYGLQGSSTHALLVVIVYSRVLASGPATIFYLILSMIALAAAYHLELAGLIEPKSGVRSGLLELLNLYTVFIAVTAASLLVMRENETESPARNNQQRTGREPKSAFQDNQYRLLADSAQDFIWTADLDLKYTYCSPSCERITGYKPHELVGASIFANLNSEEAAASYVDIFNREMQLEREVPGVGRHTSVEVEIRKKDGDTGWIEAQISFLRDDSSKVIGIVGASRDINDRIEAASRAEEVAEQLWQVQKIDSISQLAGGIAHDFNNMLVTIQGYSDLAMNHASMTDEVKLYVSEIRKAALRAENLTRQLLMFSRRQSMDRKPVVVNRFLENLQSTLARLIPANVRVELELDQEPFEISGDAGQLEQLVVNLYVNARDAMPGGGRLAISTTKLTLTESEASLYPNATPGDYVRIGVADTGVGIEPELQTRIFEPFFTTKRQGQGAGLGLSVVHGIVVEHGGFITVDSAPGNGTTIHVHLPKANKVKRETAESRVSSHETILLVEDEEQVRDIARLTLTQAGYAVLTAADGRLGLDLFLRERGNIEAIICDVIMPNMGGREFLAMVREIDETIPFIFISGYVGDPDTRNFIEHNDVLFLQKPFSGIALQQALRTAIENRDHRPSRQRLVLAIDDNEALLHLLELDIKDIGHRIMTASDSDQGLRLCGRHEFDVIFIDVDTQPLDGIEVARILRQREAQSPRIYGLTTHLTTENKNRCLAAGMNDLIIKPVNKEALRSILGGRVAIAKSVLATSDSVPLFDMNLSLDLSNNRIEVAEAMLRILVSRLPEHIEGIRNTFDDGDFGALTGRVEKLVAAVRYCGVPALAEATRRLEVTARGSNITDIEESIEILQERINELSNWHRNNPDPFGQARLRNGDRSATANP